MMLVSRDVKSVPLEGVAEGAATALAEGVGTRDTDGLGEVEGSVVSHRRARVGRAVTWPAAAMRARATTALACMMKISDLRKWVRRKGWSWEGRSS